MAENLVIVTLSDNYKINSFEDSLKKGIRDCKKKTFGEILNYMLVPNEDDDNPEYNEKERILCEKIANQKDNHESSQQFIMQYFDPKDNLHVANLSQKVCECNDVIRNETRIRNGEEIKYERIKLETYLDALGGFK